MGTACPEPSVLLKRLRDTLEAAPPSCSGTLVLPEKDLELYYGKKSPRYIDFSECASGQADLDELERACEAAPFGQNQETVLDETYRKAGKMEAEDFMLRFDVERSGLIDVVRTGFLTGPRERSGILPELYKLNVYGKGSFFKPHRDTPRASNMFGSLVIVLPAPHEGGQLVLRHEGGEWTFDAAQLLSGHADRIAYVAFFSDVEHEVLPVQSGHRVTITYNLFFAPSEPARDTTDQFTVLQPIHADYEAVKDALLAFISSPKVFARGGTLGFGLRHIYPLPTTWSCRDPEPLGLIEECLKGSDAALYYACESLGMDPQLRLITEDYNIPLMLDHLDCFETEACEDEEAWLLDECRAMIPEDTLLEGDDSDSKLRNQSRGRYVEQTKRVYSGSVLPICWVTQRNDENYTCQPYARYGNEASLSHMYVSVCLIARVPETITNTSDAEEDSEL